MTKSFIKHYFSKLNARIQYLYYKCVFGKNIIVINCWVNQSYGKIQHRNFGDELNVFLLEELTGKRVICYHSYGKKNIPNYMVIGSIIQDLADSSTIVWGAGVMRNDDILPVKPHKVCATRGKLTQDYLLKRGVSSPSIYGDPALLLPIVYHPKCKKKYKYGLIPHVKDLDLPLIQDILKSNTDIHLISLENYEDWHFIIDELCSCEAILSSSLHGLILGDTYGIPNTWVRFSSNICGGDFKYLDYFSGVNRKTKTPILLTDAYKLIDAIAALDNYEPIVFDKDALLKACPFDITL